MASINQETSPTTVVQEIVQFNDQSEIVKDEIVESNVDHAKIIDSVASDGRVHSILDFLKRPIQFAGGKIAANNAGVVNSWNFPDTLYKNPMVAEKLKGFQAFKGKLEFTLRTNQQPFQSGLFALVWLPLYDLKKKHYQCMLDNQYSLSVLPQVKLNLANTNSVTFSTHYIAPNVAYDQVAGIGTYGKLVLFAYGRGLQERATCSTGLNYTVFVRVDNPTTLFPSSAPVKTSATLYAKSLDLLENIKLAKPQGLNDFIDGAFDSAAKVGHKIVDETANLGKTFTNDLKSAVGLCRQTNIAPQVTSLSQAPDLPNYNKRGDHIQLGLDANNKIADGLNVFGQVNPEKDMLFTDIVQRPFMLHFIKWNSTDQAGAILRKRDLDPWIMWNTMGTTSDEAKWYAAPSPLCYVSHAFEYVHTSIEFEIVVAPTKMHQGRLMAVFDPCVPTIDDMTLAKSSYCYREIFDIGTDTSFKFTCEYQSTRPWLRKKMVFGSDPDKSASKASCFGKFYLMVLNPLVAGGCTCADSIDVFVYVRGCEDFKAAFPCFPNVIVPFLFKSDPKDFPEDEDRDENRIKRTIKMMMEGIMKLEDEINIAKPQGFGDENVSTEPSQEVASKALPPFTGKPHSNPGELLNQIAMGEEILSVKALIQQYRVIHGGQGFEIKNGKHFIIIPHKTWYHVYPKITYSGEGATTALEGANIIMDYIDYFQFCYLGYRGSMNISIIPSLNYYQMNSDNFDPGGKKWYMYDMSKWCARIRLLPRTAFFDTAKGNFWGRVTQINTESTNLCNNYRASRFNSVGPNGYEYWMRGAIRFTVPYYSMYQFTAHDYGYNSEADIPEFQDPGLFVHLECYPNFGTKQFVDSFHMMDEADILRAAGDDFEFGVFLGCPMLCPLRYYPNDPYKNWN